MGRNVRLTRPQIEALRSLIDAMADGAPEEIYEALMSADEALRGALLSQSEP